MPTGEHASQRSTSLVLETRNPDNPRRRNTPLSRREHLDERGIRRGGARAWEGAPCLGCGTCWAPCCQPAQKAPSGQASHGSPPSEEALSAAGSHDPASHLHSSSLTPAVSASTVAPPSTVTSWKKRRVRAGHAWHCCCPDRSCQCPGPLSTSS
eukprot:3577964-Rhodomonas_salina.2